MMIGRRDKKKMMFKTIETKKSYFTMIQMRHSLNMILSEMSGINWKPHIVLGINRGGCVPGIYLSHALEIPHEALDIRLRDHKSKPSLAVLEKAHAFQKRILIIDDINDTGETLNYIKDNFGTPDNLKFASVIHNEPSKFQGLHFKGYTINKEKNPVWIVFPWEEWQ